MQKVQILSRNSISTKFQQTDNGTDYQYQCGDCACESGLYPPLNNYSYIPDFTKNSQLHKRLVPKILSGLYLKLLGQYLVAFNPHNTNGVMVINNYGYQLLSLIDGIQTLDDLGHKLSWTLEDVQSGIFNLEKAGLVYFNFEEPKPVLAKTETLAVWLHINNQCNLRCHYCYVDKSDNAMSEEIGQKTIDSVFFSAIKNSCKEIIIKFAGGEALLDFPKVMKFTSYGKQLSKKTGIKTRFVILTNGVLINSEIARVMKAEGIVASVSLDGIDNFNDLNRPFLSGKGSYQNILRGINYLLSYEVPFNISVVLSKGNIQNLPDLTQFLLEKNLTFTFNFFRNNELSNGNDLEIDNSELIKWIGKAVDVISDVMPPYSLINAILDRVNFSMPHKYPCGVGLNYVVVKSSGDMVGCHMELQKQGFGRIDNQTDLLPAIQKNNFFRNENNLGKEKTSCKSCQWKYICAGGCPINIHNNSDNISPFCLTYKNLIPRLIELEAKRIIKYSDITNFNN